MTVCTVVRVGGQEWNADDDDAAATTSTRRQCREQAEERIINPNRETREEKGWKGETVPSGLLATIGEASV